MSCSPPRLRGWSRRHNLKDDLLQRLDPVEVDGTWDFKWSSGSSIRIAFQTPPKGDKALLVYERAIEDIIRMAALWEVNVRLDGDRNPIQKRPIPLTLHFLTQQHVPAPPPGWARPPSPPELKLKEALRYDVLISLATLPVKIPRSADEGGPEEILLPRTELGRYARRLEYGLPTAFAGAFRPGQDLAALLVEPEWRYTVLHELGHILGMAHPYQQDEAALQWTPDQLKVIVPRILRRALRPEQLESYIDRQYRTQLPKGNGTSFSDRWRDPGARSVMSTPFASPAADPKRASQSVVVQLPEGNGVKNGNGSRGGNVRRSGSGNGGPTSYFEDWLPEPTPDDLEHLQSMYLPRRLVTSRLTDSSIAPPGGGPDPKDQGETETPPGQ
jgi:hypothetical protein